MATGIEEHQKGERQGSEAQRQGQRFEGAGPPDTCGWGDGQLPPGYLSLLLKGHRHLTMCKSLMFKHPVKQFLDPLKSRKCVLSVSGRTGATQKLIHLKGFLNTDTWREGLEAQVTSVTKEGLKNNVVLH